MNERQTDRDGRGDRWGFARLWPHAAQLRSGPASARLGPEPASVRSRLGPMSLCGEPARARWKVASSGWRVVGVIAAVLVAAALPGHAVGQATSGGAAGDATSGGGQAGSGGGQVAGGRLFKIVFDPALQTDNYTGKVYVFLTTEAGQEPRKRVHSFLQFMQPAPVFSKVVRNAAPTRPIIIDASADHYPYAIDALPAKVYSVQAVARRNRDLPNPGISPGDLYSDVVKLDAGAWPDEPIELRLTRAVPPAEPPRGERLRTFEQVSPLLSRFFGRPVTMRAWVHLPVGWKEDDARRYPILYCIGGFGGGPEMAKMLPFMLGYPKLQTRMLVVVPDARCYRGHHVFADSANNGPVGRAFVEEFIPALEKRFHATGSPKHRYVTGASSGGWASLYLQIMFPEAFNGCWSHVPDPVDFRDFQRIDLYKPGANMYRDERGDRRPLMRQRDRVILYYEDFVHVEDVLNPGGQIASFEAVFSPKGADGEPVPLFDRKTGAVDPRTAEAWKRYDLRLILEQRWATLGPKLRGKLHIYAGEFDNFYLEGAVRRLKDSLSALRGDAEVEVISGAGHGFQIGPRVGKMFEEILSNFRKEYPLPAEPATPDAPVTGQPVPLP